MSFKCKECSQDFPSERSLHTHLKAHSIYIADYYCKHYPRKDSLTGESIQFKDKDQYFSSYFSCRKNMLEWFEVADSNEAKDLALTMFQDRVKSKKLSIAPNEIELFFANLPPLKIYKNLFGSYTKVCELVGVKPPFTDKLPDLWAQDYSKKKVWIDTREQNPLVFANSESLKLDTGDYSVGGEDFKNTFVDRKSFDDWCGTLVGNNLERFRREITRCKTQNCYLWVVIECPLEDVYSLSRASYHKPNISYIAHNMRLLSSEFSGSLQFLFSGSRENSQTIIPKLLCLGDKLFNVDMQYFVGGQS